MDDTCLSTALSVLFFFCLSISLYLRAARAVPSLQPSHISLSSTQPSAAAATTCISYVVISKQANLHLVFISPLDVEALREAASEKATAPSASDPPASCWLSACSTRVACSLCLCWAELQMCLGADDARKLLQYERGEV